MKNSDILKILSPLIFFFLHIAYLVALSSDPFLNKWIDGSFTFFVALVLCNIIRARVVASAEADDPDAEGPGESGAPETTESPRTPPGPRESDLPAPPRR